MCQLSWFSKFALLGMSSVIDGVKVTISGLHLLLYIIITQTVPINNGFSMKFSPVHGKDEVKSKSFGAFFAKIPQDMNSKATQGILSHAVIPQISDLGIGCTNQIAKLLFPSRISHNFNYSESSESPNFINIPIINQPFDDYKIIIATAPKHIRIGKGEEAKPVVVYIVFFEDNANDLKTVNMPSIYFVNKVNDKAPFEKKEKVDPILIIDNNRTVTGLKSTEISKFVKFKNKLTNRQSTQVAP